MKANLALVKYWGKRDEKLHLPMHSSISVTLEELRSITTVEFNSDYSADQLILNGKNVDIESEEYRLYAGHFLSIIREQSGTSLHARVASENNFPTGAGRASSASGFAAFALAADSALNLGLTVEQLSVLARRGSGSATRSILGGFNAWQAGERADGSDSCIRHLAGAEHWPELRVIACITQKAEKKVKSRSGMTSTLRSSELYQDSWLPRIEDDLKEMQTAIAARDFTLLGSVAEKNALRMHATMMTSEPPIIYFNDTTRELLDKICEFRERGIEAYCTMDAGPQVKVLCLETNLNFLIENLRDISGVQELRPCCVASENARILDQHLF